MDRPQTSYAWNDGTALAYQVVGASGPDLLLVPGSVSHLEVLWDEPRVHRFLTRCARFCRLIIMDPRGLGLSDRLTEIPTLEDRVDDLMSVLDAAESERATLFGNADTGPPCIAATVSHPDRVGGLILCGTYAKASWSEDYPWGWTVEEFADFRKYVRDGWGTAQRIEMVAPSMVGDQAFLQWSGTLMRLGASPRAVLLLGEMTMAVDVRPLLPQIAIPTLVMHRIGDRINEVDHGRYLADHIPGARWVELPGDDLLLWAGNTDGIADEELPFFLELHGGDADQGLGLGRDAEDRVFLHGGVGIEVARAEGARIRDLATARDQHHRARELAVPDVALEGVGEALQALRRQADLLRLGRPRKRLGEEGRRVERRRDQREEQRRSDPGQHCPSLHPRRRRARRPPSAK